MHRSRTQDLYRVVVSGLLLAACAAPLGDDPSAEPRSSEDLALASDGITVASPSNNSSVGSPVVVKATVATCSGAKTTAFGYSVDNSSAITWGSATSIAKSDSSISQGTHTIHFKAWSGAILCPVISRTVTVSGTSGGYDGSHVIPFPPSTATAFANIDGLTNWSHSTGAASSCPDGVVSATCNPPNANYNHTVLHVADPGSPPAGDDRTAGLFQLYDGPKWATVIWGHSIGTSTAARHFIWDFSMYVNATDYATSELDFYQILSGHRFMLGTQCNRGANSWDTWNEATQHWIHHPTIPCNNILTASKWHRVVMYLSTSSSSNSYTYHAFRIDGVDYPLNETDYAKSSNWPNGLIGVQIQLDANDHGKGVNEYIDGMKAYAW